MAVSPQPRRAEALMGGDSDDQVEAGLSPTPYLPLGFATVLRTYAASWVRAVTQNPNALWQRAPKAQAPAAA